jgi:molecular chaperone HtpG
MEKYFNAVQPESGMKAERCLELNMNHPAVQKMSELIGTDDEKAKKYAEIFYNQALLIAGLPIDDPSGYADIVSSIM